MRALKDNFAPTDFDLANSSLREVRPLVLDPRPTFKLLNVAAEPNARLASIKQFAKIKAWRLCTHLRRQLAAPMTFEQECEGAC